MLPQAQQDNSSSADDQALAWVARLRSDACRNEDKQAFAFWLAQDTDHLMAMDAALELWDDLAGVRHLPFDLNTRPAANQPRWWAAAAIAASLVLAVVLLPLMQSNESRTLLQTAYGEQSQVELEDGSRLRLNANSQVEVAYSDDQRLLELLRGEVYFEVAKNASRPFHVDTGSARVTALGTAFNILKNDDEATITVTEGVVRVTEIAATASRVPASELLHANQQIQTSTQGLLAAMAVEPAASLAWQKGEIIAQGMPLAQLATELERFNGLHILIADPDIAAMTVSGIFRLEQPEAILQALEVSHGLQLTRLNEDTLQLLKSQQ